MDLSNNPLGEGGVRELSEALYKTYTLLSLKLRCCNMNDAGCQYLIKALQINASIRYLDIEGNDLSPESVYTALAEVQAANDIDALRVDAQGVDANTLSIYVSSCVHLLLLLYMYCFFSHIVCYGHISTTSSSCY